MLLSFHELIKRHEMKVTGVLHLGAHLAEEAPLYQEQGIRNVWWVEGNARVLPKIDQVLRHYPGQRLIHAVVYERDGAELDFNVTNYDGMSSSILEFGTHPTFSPDTVFIEKVRVSTRSVDSLVMEHGIAGANLLNMDLQGAELSTLKGATGFLRGVDYVLSEVNRADVYVGCAKVWELDAHLVDFTRVETYWVPNQDWGDALWIRTSAP